MKARALPLVSVTRSGVVWRPAATRQDTCRLELGFGHSAEGALADPVHDARSQGLTARFRGLRVDTALAPTRQ